MGILDIFNKNIIEEKTEAIIPEPTIESLKGIDYSRYKWTEGYKGTNDDMTCRGFQFELNKEYTVEGDTRMCDHGFHLCEKLEDVFKYYSPLDKTRFFKVKALVDMKERDAALRSMFSFHEDKLVAKTIILTEEISKEELLPLLSKKYPLITTVDDLDKAREIGYVTFEKQLFIGSMDKNGLGYDFSEFLYCHIRPNQLKETIRMIECLQKENVSHDMIVKILMDFIMDRGEFYINRQ